MVNLESSEKAYGVSLGIVRDRGGQQKCEAILLSKLGLGKGSENGSFPWRKAVSKASVGKPRVSKTQQSE